MANYFGADVHARYQAGFKVKNLPGCDFVITKCTGGTSFKIDGWLGMLDGASKTGVYHYARERGYQGTAKQLRIRLNAQLFCFKAFGRFG